MGVDYSQHSLELAQDAERQLGARPRASSSARTSSHWSLPDASVRLRLLQRRAAPHQRSLRRLPAIWSRSRSPGGLIVVGLYNRYGRLDARVRRRVVRLLSRFDPRAKDRAIEKQLVELDADEEKRRTWYADQYEHPHESTHTVDEVLGWFRANGLDVRLVVPEDRAVSGSMPKRIFRKREVAGWRSAAALAHVLVQLSWIVTQNAGGGYFVLVGRKRVMNILGISCFYHDAAACLIRDGVVVAAASEERFTRKKHDAELSAPGDRVLSRRGPAAGRRSRLRRLLREAVRQVQAHPVHPARHASRARFRRSCKAMPSGCTRSSSIPSLITEELAVRRAGAT